MWGYFRLVYVRYSSVFVPDGAGCYSYVAVLYIYINMLMDSYGTVWDSVMYFYYM